MGQNGDVATIDLITSVLSEATQIQELIVWPPDVFAVVAYLLQKSGAYIEIVRDWPPSKNSASWADEMRHIGQAWRQACNNGTAVPNEVQLWWKHLLGKKHIHLMEIALDAGLIADSAQLLAAADEACAGVGIPDFAPGGFDTFENRAHRNLRGLGRANASTLCENIDPALFRVLPKLHTPQSGTTIRSLSHHLSLCPAGEVNSTWIYHPPAGEPELAGMNLLLIPWPTEINLLDFSPANIPAALRNIPKAMGFFSYERKSSDPWPTAYFEKLIRKAVDTVGRIDGVILPELSLASDSEYDQLYSVVTALTKRAFLIAGVGGRAPDSSFGLNQLRYRSPILLPTLRLDHVQGKHHRWRLDESQIRQYQLTHRLDPYKFWWENMDLRERKVHFFSINPWLTMCALICEDLARQDPVAEVLRSVGPNLIVALLMDGPQLQMRWSGKYATVFADDPGSSVLCLTSLGMATLSKPGNGSNDSTRRIVGLWKDAKTGAREIDLPDDVDAVVLSINRTYHKEWSADGRDDGGTTSYLTFGRLHYV